MSARSRHGPPILSEGANCWKISKANRVSLLVDTDSYYRALHACLREARRSIYIVGWELDPEMRLIVGEEPADGPAALAPLLTELLSRRASLRIHVLQWDYAPVRVGEKIVRPLPDGRWPNDARFRRHVDGAHATGASHHEKIVVVDDEVAFCGGMDLTWRRWDTSEHRPNDPRRVDRRGNDYGAWHDNQLAVEGPIASVLGDIVRERWRRATGEELEPPGEASKGESPWPPELEPDLRNTPVAASRTLAAFGDYPEVREIQALYLDAIREAREWIYIENQYLTSKVVGDALAKRLQERDGPEVVIVVPDECVGWLEEGLMKALRVRLLNHLEKADRYNRLRTYCPIVAGGQEGYIDLHSKVLVVDDRLFSVGSANVSNRSMTLDTETNLVLEATRSARSRRQTIARFRNRLLAEHLGVELDLVGETLEQTQSLIKSIDGLATNERTLEPLSNEYPDWIKNLAPSSSLSDPERPVDSGKLVEALVPKRAADLTNHPLLKALAAGLVVTGLALWKFWPRNRR